MNEIGTKYEAAKEVCFPSLRSFHYLPFFFIVSFTYFVPRVLCCVIIKEKQWKEVKAFFLQLNNNKSTRHLCPFSRSGSCFLSLKSRFTSVPLHVNEKKQETEREMNQRPSGFPCGWVGGFGKRTKLMEQSVRFSHSLHYAYLCSINLGLSPPPTNRIPMAEEIL